MLASRIADDETDYFTSENNHWLSPDQRQALKVKEAEIQAVRDASRRTQRLTIDLAGRRVVDSGDFQTQGPRPAPPHPRPRPRPFLTHHPGRPAPWGSAEERLRDLYASELAELNATPTQTAGPSSGASVPLISNEEKARRAAADAGRAAPTASAPTRVQHDLDHEPWDLEAVPTGARAEDDVACAVDLSKLSLEDAADEGLCLSMVPRARFQADARAVPGVDHVAVDRASRCTVAAVGVAAGVRGQARGGPAVVHVAPRPPLDRVRVEEARARRGAEGRGRPPRSQPYALRSCTRILLRTRTQTQPRGPDVGHVADDAGTVTLPEFYPTSCLLGCVDIVDCLSLAEYRAQVMPRTTLFKGTA